MLFFLIIFPFFNSFCVYIYVNKFFFEAQQFLLSFLRIFNSYLKGGYDCIICGRKTFLRQLCPVCLNSFFNVKSALEKSRCERCGKVLVSAEKICFSCREKPILFNVDLMLPVFSYRLWNKELMFLWKSEEIRSLSSVFARVLFEVLKIHSEKNGLFSSDKIFIVPVPPRKGKIQEKGWDQIEDLCQFLDYRYGFRILRILQRNSTVQQKKLNRKERLSHMQSAYSMKCNAELLKILKPFNMQLPEKVWLIDDVCTTGSTIECCAKILKEGGIKTVNAVTLFNVD